MNISLWKQQLDKSTAVLRGLAEWWGSELKTLLVADVRNSTKRRIEVRPQGDGIELRIIRGEESAVGHLTADGSISPPELLSLRDRKQAQLPVWLIPPADVILSKTVQIPRSAAPHFPELLPIEISRWTPFSLDQLVLAWRRSRDRQDNKADIEIRFIPRTSLSDWLETLLKGNLQVGTIVLGDMQIPIGAISTAKRRERQLRIAAVVALIVAATAFVASDWIAASRERNRWTQRIQDERREIARQQTVQSKIDEIVGAAREAREAESRARGLLLAKIAAVLPESDWLTDLSLRGGTITLRGYSLRPELLLKAIESLAAERAVTLQGEVTFDARLNRNRFSLAFQAVGPAR